MNKYISTKKFKKDIKGLDNQHKNRVKKQIKKILDNPEVGKPLRYSLSGIRAIYLKPFRITYKIKGNTIQFLRFRHHDQAYKRR